MSAIRGVRSKKDEPIRPRRVLMGARHALALLWLLAACEGTVGDVLTPPHPDAPLGTVPAGCADARQAGPVCLYEAGWRARAERACADGMAALSAHVLLDVCGPGFYRGVYYRCCTGKEEP